MAGLTGSLLARSPQLWPVSCIFRFFREEEKMTRAFALLFAALTLLAGAGQAQAQFFFEDSRDIMGGGPGFFRPGMPSGSSPIQRTTGSFTGGYSARTNYLVNPHVPRYLLL